MNGKRMLTGIKPSGSPTLGNYIGAIKPCVNHQEAGYEMFVFVANLHAITVYQDAKELRQNTKDLIALYLAAGLNPSKTTIFLQTDVLEHAEIGFILTCQTTMGELSRMTQYKDKKSKNETIGTGIFIYPGLMAADILIYDPDFVPTGEDQKQHVELARDIAERFNTRYGETFKVPESLLAKDGARIMSLQNPLAKMSKSEDGDKGCIFLLDDINLAKKKIKSAITDSEAKIYYDKENKPGISNLLTIYSSLTNRSIDDIVEAYQGKNYGEFKNDLAEIVGKTLEAIQSRYKEIINSNMIDEILVEGAQKAKAIAYKKLRKVHYKTGLSLKK